MYFPSKKSLLINIDAQLLGKAQARRIDIARVLEEALAAQIRLSPVDAECSARSAASMGMPSQNRHWTHPKREHESSYRHLMQNVADSILQTGI